MSASRTHLTDEETVVLETMSAIIMGSMGQVTQALRNACAGQPSLQLSAAIASYIAYISGQMAARAEFVAYNAGGDKENVEALCAGSFHDGRDAAFAEQMKSGGLKLPNAPTTGAAQ